MKENRAIKNALQNYNENELIFASRLYKDELYGKTHEAAYYKALERMCKSGELVRIAKGIYHLPKISRYGIVPPSESEIVSAFTENGKGTVIGYSLYNSLNLTTQIPRTINVLSSAIDSFSKSVRNIVVHKSLLDYTKPVENMVRGLEVLQNFTSIQDISYSAFIEFARDFSSQYNDEVFEKVIAAQSYKKSTIAFMREILEFYGVNNRLDRHLSALSEYKHPRMEEIYEAAQIDR